MPGTTSTALLSFSHDQHHETDAAKRKGGIATLNIWLLVSVDSMIMLHTWNIIFCKWSVCNGYQSVS